MLDAGGCNDSSAPELVLVSLTKRKVASSKQSKASILEFPRLLLALLFLFIMAI